MWEENLLFLTGPDIPNENTIFNKLNVIITVLHVEFNAIFIIISRNRVTGRTFKCSYVNSFAFPNIFLDKRLTGAVLHVSDDFL